MDDEVKIQVRFTIDDPDTGTSFTDALYYPLGIYETLKPEDIAAEKQARFDTWKQTVADAQSAPPSDPIIDIANIDDQIDLLTAQRTAAVQDVASNYSLPVEQIEQAVNAIQAQPDEQKPVDPIKVVADDIAAQALDNTQILTDAPVDNTPVVEKANVAQSDIQIGG